ncbi:MAG: hypothetical protein CM1200mP2_38090 [Planctomycetaceae bacterium]|nr:MAG: hypothetical protein CM1200mP2_38090 [Planctomycetaceae bacterium]
MSRSASFGFAVIDVGDDAEISDEFHENASCSRGCDFAPGQARDDGRVRGQGAVPGHGLDGGFFFTSPNFNGIYADKGDMPRSGEATIVEVSVNSKPHLGDPSTVPGKWDRNSS